ncbi:hypothetical protein HOLleu_16019 [Holothuria leucospilota]|uniref:Uncharacterized protein n=1 Tax=Holothuria leucospilota TaxID=206669 RepID=A0A9Q1HAL5_HOLLE|nr:hypothetical protein HOLleu_16019 [Holothuria leucospilota]
MDRQNQGAHGQEGAGGQGPAPNRQQGAGGQQPAELQNFRTWLDENNQNNGIVGYLAYVFEVLVRARMFVKEPQEITMLRDQFNNPGEQLLEINLGIDGIDINTAEFQAFILWYGKKYRNQDNLQLDAMPDVNGDTLLKYILFVIKCLREEAQEDANNWTVILSDILCVP